jgi:rhodanese-related sulfurtransferase
MKTRLLPNAILFVFSLLMLFLGMDGTAVCEEPKKILSIEAYDMLNTVPDTFLIDVRTQPEYQFVGHPFKAYLYPYQFFTNQFSKGAEKPGYLLSPKSKNFVDQIGKAFRKTDNLLIICRDGIRSALAARDLLNAGFKNVFDVTDGFEGPEFPVFENGDRHKFYRQLAKRNKVYGFEHRRHYGWQYWGLPWTYEMDPKYIYPPDLNTPEK